MDAVIIHNPPWPVLGVLKRGVDQSGISETISEYVTVQQNSLKNGSFFEPPNPVRTGTVYPVPSKVASSGDYVPIPLI